MHSIITNNGIYYFQGIDLYYGRKLIDINICRQNLIKLKKILDIHSIKFGIIYGTLLGAVREKNFLEYDEDVDIYILDEFKEEFLSLLFTLKLEGFDVARYSGNLLSLIRQDDYIDVYFFKKKLFWRECGIDRLPGTFFEDYDTISFLEDEYRCPYNHIKFLEKAYGKDWKTPKRGCPANVKSVEFRIRMFIKKFIPQKILNILKTIKNYDT